MKKMLNHHRIHSNLQFKKNLNVSDKILATVFLCLKRDVCQSDLNEKGPA